MSVADFERLVADALDEIPAELASIIDNCVILVEDRPPSHAPGLLGLYEGIPLTERDSRYAGVLPDRIFIFRLPILSVCESADEVRQEVHVTVVHEVAHHFGISDARLRELGYG